MGTAIVGAMSYLFARIAANNPKLPLLMPFGLCALLFALGLILFVLRSSYNPTSSAPKVDQRIKSGSNSVNLQVGNDVNITRSDRQ